MDDEAGRWMTFAELATARSSTKRAAIMLVRRHKWRRQKDNAGNVRAFVPATWAEPVIRHTDGTSSGNSSGHSDHYTAPALELLEKTLVALQEAHARELAVLREAHTAEAAILRQATDAARANAQAAQDRADELVRTEEARRSAGRWARLRAAWRGEEKHPCSVGAISGRYTA